MNILPRHTVVVEIKFLSTGISRITSDAGNASVFTLPERAIARGSSRWRR